MIKRYIFDIDGTVCTNTNGDYIKAEPIYDRIAVVNKLYDNNNQIVFFTARGMQRFGGNVNSVTLELEELTKSQLEKWGVKFHKLIMGKPSGDIYVDDKGISDLDFFSRELE
jgi:capsule biosynthesis phosphatase